MDHDPSQSTVAGFAAGVWSSPVDVRDATMPFITFYLPEDPEYLAAIGAVVVRQSQLDHALLMTVKSLLGWTVSATHDLQRKERRTTPRLREKVLEQARALLRDEPVLAQLEQLLKRCEDLVEQDRNDVLHGLWATDIDRSPLLVRHGEHRAIPPIDELRRLAAEMFELAEALNRGRLDGELGAAIRAARDS